VWVRVPCPPPDDGEVWLTHCSDTAACTGSNPVRPTMKECKRKPKVDRPRCSVCPADWMDNGVEVSPAMWHKFQCSSLKTGVEVPSTCVYYCWNCKGTFSINKWKYSGLHEYNQKMIHKKTCTKCHKLNWYPKIGAFSYGCTNCGECFYPI
jgi:hypothetical protein